MMNRANRRLTVVVTAFLAQQVGCFSDAVPNQGASAAAAASASGDDTIAAPAPRVPELALAYVPGEGQTDREIAKMQAAVRKHPESVDAHLALATMLMRRGRETSAAVFSVYAEDVVTAARMISPGDPRIRLIATMHLLDQHKFEAAASAAQELSGQLPSDPTPKILLGDASLELGNYDAASEAYQSAIDLRPDLRSYNRAAYMRWLYGDFEGAVEIMELALDAGSMRDPESMAWCFADLGAMFLERGDERRAGAAADRALALVKGYAPANVVKARSLARGGDFVGAIAALEASVQARPTTAEYLQLHELYTAASQPDDAQRARQTAERLAEQDPRPLAEFLARRGEAPERALALAEQELDARENIWAHDTHALALARVGRIGQARDAMTKAMALGTEDPDFYLHRALIELLGGEHDEARRNLAEAMRRDPKVDPLLVAELGRGLRSV